MPATLRVVHARHVDESGLDEAERTVCAELGMAPMRMAARVAAKQAAVTLMGGGTSTADLTVLRDLSGAPRLDSTVPSNRPLPSLSMSHSAGWGAALAWLP